MFKLGLESSNMYGKVLLERCGNNFMRDKGMEGLADVCAHRGRSFDLETSTMIHHTYAHILHFTAFSDTN
jgi:hypothetical protein